MFGTSVNAPCRLLLGLAAPRGLDILGNMDSKDAIAAFAALAQGTRLDAFRLLVRAGAGGLPAGAIGETLGVAPATLSFHLKELKNAGLVACECEGTSRIYSPNLSAIEALIRFLTAHCCEGVAGSGPPGRRRDEARGTSARARRAPRGRQR